jgi:DnaJ-class molecular chaperone
MSRPYKCSECDGRGEVPVVARRKGQPMLKACGGCDGKGLVQTPGADFEWSYPLGLGKQDGHAA